jgi:hypothetical protein
MPKKAQFTQERVEYNVFSFDEPLKGSKSLKIFKISLTFRFDKLCHLSKPAHTGEISQILTVSNKKFNKLRLRVLFCTLVLPEYLPTPIFSVIPTSRFGKIKVRFRCPKSTQKSYNCSVLWYVRRNKIST